MLLKCPFGALGQETLHGDLMELYLSSSNYVLYSLLQIDFIQCLNLPCDENMPVLRVTSWQHAGSSSMNP